MKKSLILIIVLVSFLFLNSNIFSQPNPPENLTATQINSMNHPAVKLQWMGANASMIKYKVFKKIGGVNDTTSFFEIASNIMHPSFIDNMVLPNATYSYFVKAFNSQGTSEPSDTVEITITAPPAPSVVTGTVFNDANNQPIAGAKVQFLVNSSIHGNLTAITNNLGEFRIVLPPGTYFMRTSAMHFVSEYYDNVPNVQQATPIVLASGDSLNFNIGLAAIVPPVFYTLSGHVADSSGSPLKARINVLPVRTNTFFTPQMCSGTVTDSLGNYTVQVRENDTVIVFCKPFNFNFIPEYWDNKLTFAEADRIPVTGNITNIDFVINPKPVFNNGISGVVKNPDNEGVEAHISAFNMSINTSTNHHRKITTATDSLGNYSFTNLTPGQYILLAIPQMGYRPTFFQYNGTPTMNWREADSVEVTETSLVTGIDFTVLPFSAVGLARVTGQVNDNLDTPVSGAIVFAVDNNLNVYSYAITDANGNYIMEGFVPGDYQIICDKVDYTSSGDQWVNLDYSSNISMNASFTITPDAPTSVEDNNIIENFELMQNYPNPFNPATLISFQLPVQNHVTLKVFDILGNEIATLVNEEKPAGKYSVSFDAGKFSSGVYFYSISAGSFSQTKKMVLTK